MSRTIRFESDSPRRSNSRMIRRRARAAARNAMQRGDYIGAVAESRRIMFNKYAAD